MVGQDGLLPHRSKDMVLGRKTYNCRAETAVGKRSVRESWTRMACQPVVRRIGCAEPEASQWGPVSFGGRQAKRR